MYTCRMWQDPSSTKLLYLLIKHIKERIKSVSKIVSRHPLLSSLLRISIKLSTPLYRTPVTIPSGLDSVSSNMPFLISTYRSLTLTLTPAVAPAGEVAGGWPMQHGNRFLQLQNSTQMDVCMHEHETTKPGNQQHI
jgi:hypothetical protein